ncbi:MAG: class I SAM-dependent methyltransferase [Burkholderiaceae bacterium]
MSALAQRLLKRHYRAADHPYRQFERVADSLVQSHSVLLDAGCGRTVPVLRRYLGKARRLIGVELVPFTDVPPGIETYNADLSQLPLESESVDLIISRSVFEHLTDPESVYAEFARVLRPGGAIVFLTANMWDYGTTVARLVPNRFHAAIVKEVEGRAEADTFPTAYRTNTRRAVDRFARNAGLAVERFDYLGQYPNYLLFNGVLFFFGMCFERIVAKFSILKVLRGWILVVLRKPARDGLPGLPHRDPG